MYKKVLVPMALDHDVSPSTLKIAHALLAEGGEIVGLHVHEEPPGSVRAYVDEITLREGVDRAWELLREKLKDLPDIQPVMVKGHPARAIIDYCEANAVDCVVVGSHKPGLSDYFLGSTASRVVRHATCAVHVHRSH